MTTSQSLIPKYGLPAAMMIVLTVFAVGCGDDGGSSSSTYIAPADRSWVEEGELLDDPSLMVTPKQVVMLHLNRTRRGETRIRHVIPYRFEDTTTYTFCIPEEEPHVRSAELFEHDATTPLLRIVPGAACETLTIEEGEYRLEIEHDGTGIDDRGRKAFVHVPRLKEDPETLESTSTQGSTTPGGFISCDALAVLTTSPSGYFVIKGQGNNPVPVFGQSPSVDLAVGGWQICNVTGGAFSFYLGGANPQALQNGTFANQGIFAETDGRLTVHNNVTNPYASPFDLVDLGDFQFQFYTSALVNGVATPTYPIVPASDGSLHWSTTATPLTYGVPIKYYLPGVTPPALRTGEISLNHGCNFDTTHGTWVVRGNLPNTTSGLSGSAPFGIYYNNPEKGTLEFLNQPTANMSVRTGPDTVVSFYQQTNYFTLLQDIGETTACTGSSIAGFNSIKVAAARDFIIATNYCRNCDLTGIELAGLDLSNGNFSGTTFTGANLNITNFNAANLTSANLAGSAIQMVQAIFDNATLTNTNFRSADLSTASAHSTEGLVVAGGFANHPDLTGATIDVKTFLPSDWRYLNLTGAQVHNADGAVLSTSAKPVDFSAAQLDSVDLHGAVLDSANFGCAIDPGTSMTVCAQLVDVNLNKASLKRASFVNANLQGANFDFANLDEANLCSAKLNQSADKQKSASLQGAYLRNVNLVQADLTGANLSNADFYSTTTTGICGSTNCAATNNCASAADATINSATFANAYLSGTDFSDASCKGVDFTGAFLLGANFTKTNLSGDNNTGFTASFRQAYLQGTNLSTANVTNANFDGAYIDVKKAAATVKLENANISFTGFAASPPSAAGCVQFTYPNASATPSTNNGNTCPDGSTGPCTAAQWVLPTPTPGCSSFDFNWGVAPTPVPTVG